MPEHDRQYLELVNKTISIRLQGAGRGLAFLQPAGSEGFVCSATDLYALELTAPSGGKRTVNASEAIRFEYCQESTGEYLFTFTHHIDGQGGAVLRVMCHILLNAQDMNSEWRIAIDNSTGYAIQKVRYPLVILEKREVDPALRSWRYDFDWNSTYSSAMLLGLFDGSLVPEPHDTIPDGFGWVEEHPGRMSAQMIAYFDTSGGICLYTQDGIGSPKLLGFKRQGASLDISPTHLFPREYGAGIDLSYAVTLAPFQGDWTAAADAYKRWAKTQDWTKVRLVERADIPAWVKTGFPFFLYVQARPKGSDHYAGWQDTLPRQMLPVLKTYEKLLESPLVAVIFGWEKHDSWITPDVFPVYPADEELRTLVAGLKESGSRVFVYNSGTRWAVKNPRRPEWDGMDYWEKEGGRQASCVGEDGEWTYDARPWAVNHKLCIAAEGTYKMMDRYVDGFIDLGLDATQYDQNLGGETYVCFDGSHGHPQGYGRWMTDAAKRMLKRFLERSRQHNPDFSISVEQPNEVLIPELTFYDSRTQIYHGWPLLTNMPCLGVPLFSYLYHEYAVGFAGDLGIGLITETPPGTQEPTGAAYELVKTGRVAASGYLPLVFLQSNGYAFEQINDAIKAGQPVTGTLPPALALLKNIAHANMTYAHNFMVLGQMCPAPHYEVSEFYELKKTTVQSYYNDDRVDYVYPDKARVRVPVVLGSAWRSPDGAFAYTFINISQNRQKVNLDCSNLEFRLPGAPTDIKHQVTLQNLEGSQKLEMPPVANNFLTLELPGLQVSVLAVSKV